MHPTAAASHTGFTAQLDQLFYLRTLVCHRLAAVFFPLFSLLDFVCYREEFQLFLGYRLFFVVIVLFSLILLRMDVCKPFTKPLMYGNLLIGTMIISLMVNKLGGFSSGYYVGILLMIAGAFSVLPLNIKQSLSVGLSMYLVYLLTVLIGQQQLDGQDLVHIGNNSFFFFALIGVTTVQSFDDLQTQLSSLRGKYKLQSLHRELSHYTGNLETLVKQRLEQLEESALKFMDLYHNLQDMVMLIDADGTIHMANRQCGVLLGIEHKQLAGRHFAAFIRAADPEIFVYDLFKRINEVGGVEGVQLQMTGDGVNLLDVELSGNRVEPEPGTEFFQLIIRDITLNKEMENKVFASNRLIDTSRQAAIFGLAKLAECRDDDTGAHLNRIRAYTRILTEQLSRSPDFRHSIDNAFKEDIFRSSVLHDIGKVGIPDAILLKPDKLTTDEFETMKHHCEFGGTTLSEAATDDSTFSFLRMGQEIAKYHHERWDGSGYPDGLAGSDIPLAARIVALADVYDALTSSRIYKTAYNHEEARKRIIRESGRQFDPRVVNAFLQREHDFKRARMNLLVN